jgi:hypothetical protein
MTDKIDETPRNPSIELPAPMLLSLLARLHEGKDIRDAKVRRIRSAVRMHSYENDLKLDIALERMLEDL